MNILLIVPPTDVYLTPLMGIGILSAMAKKAGHCVEVLDLNILLYNDPEINKLLWRRELSHYLDIQAINDFIWDISLGGILERSIPNFDGDIDMVGIRTSANSKLMAIKIAKWFRTNHPNTTTVAGGPQTWYGYKSEYFDKIIHGYAEVKFAELVGLPSMEGVIPDFSFASKYNYINNNMLPVETSRGCVHHCGFCSERIFEKFKTFPVDYVQKCFHYARDRGYKEIYFTDSLLNHTPNYLNGILDALKDYGLTCRCNLTPFNISRGNIERLTETATNVFCGIETFSNSFASKLGKPGERAQIIEVLHLMKEMGLSIETGMIIGGPPFQTHKEFLEDIDAIILHRDVLSKVIVSPLRIFKGTSLHTREFNGYSAIGWGTHEGDFDNRLSWLKEMTEKLQEAGIYTEVPSDGIKSWISGLRKENKRYDECIKEGR